MDGDATLDISNEIRYLTIPKEIVFPDELNRYLRGQIEYLMHENGMLKKHLQENETSIKDSSSEIETLKLKLKEYQNIGNKHQFSSATTIASAKIVELSKRLRDKNSEVESLKTKCSKLEKKIFELQDSKLNEVPEKKNSEETSTASKSENEDPVKKLQDKLSVTSMKLREVQNTNIHLKNELKMANKYLQQEVGDTLETISNNNNQGWRGRAQIICDLHQKNQELKEKLKLFQTKGGLEITKKAEKKLDNLNKENEGLKNVLDEQKKKIEVLRARCKVLETEQTINKSKITALSAQTERDQSLLKTLTNQVTNQQEVTNETIKQKDKYIKGLQQDNEILRIELSKQKVIAENLTKDLNDKVEEIRDLMRNRRKSPRPISSYGQRNKHLMDDKLVNRLEVEKTRLLELTELQASRITAEREAHAKTQNRLCQERQKAAKLETNLAKLELEVNSAPSGGSYFALQSYRSIDMKNNNNSDVKDELELAQETIKALQTRLEIEQHERKVDLKEFTKILESNY